jgi:hypothetical protein
MNKDGVRRMNLDLSDSQRLLLAEDQLRKWRTTAMIAAHSLEIAIENKSDRAGVMQSVLDTIRVILKDTPVARAKPGSVSPQLFGARR